MIKIGESELIDRYVTDSNGVPSRVRKVYAGDNLVHLHITDNTPFAYRKVCNGEVQEDILVKGKIEKVKGNTVVWNQIANALNVASEVYGITRERRGNALHYSGTSTKTTNFTGIRFAVDPINTHKYYLSAKGIPNSCRIGTYGAMTIPIGKDSYVGTYGFINFGVYIPEGVTIDADVYFACIDLTLIYGEGNEPTTPEQFEADYQRWFGKPLTYEPYNEGELIPVNMTGIKSVGFNQWDEEWEQGAISVITGNYIDDINRIRPKNFISVLPNTSYYLSVASKPTGRVYVIFYSDDITKMLSYETIESSRTFVTPTNCRFIKFSFETIAQYGGTYNNDICINFSDPAKNGTYEAYRSTTVPIPVKTLTGKLNGEGSSVTIFPDGMKGVNDIKDEIYIEGGVTKAIKRIGSVDLGSLNWELYSAQNCFRLNSSVVDSLNMKRIVGSLPSPMKCGIYISSPTYAWDDYDKAIRGPYNTSTYSGYFMIKDTSYTNATTFKAAMSGVMLYYELAEVEVYEVDDFTLPQEYVVKGLGTEEILSDTTSAPANMTIDYRLGNSIY